MYNKTLNILNIQKIAYILFAISSIIGVFLTIDNINTINNKKHFLTNEEFSNLNIFNKYLLIIVFILFICIYIEYINEAKAKGTNIDPLKTKILGNTLYFIGALFILNGTLKSPGKSGV